MERVFACDSAKRTALLRERGFDLLELTEVFTDRNRLDFLDARFDYGEERRVTIGIGLGRIFTGDLHGARSGDMADHRMAGEQEGT